jgi:arylsulfatase A-like enzyme
MTRPDVIIIMTDEERAIPPYESDNVLAWRRATLTGRAWFDDNAINFNRHYTGSLACVPSRPTIFTGHYPDVHGVTQTDGLGKMADDSRLRWLPEGEVPTLGNWFRTAGYDTHYDGKWHISHADLHDAQGDRVTANDDEGNVDAAAVEQYRVANPLDTFGFDGWVGPEPHGGQLADSGVRRDPLIAARVTAWLEDRYARRTAGEPDAQRPFLLVASFVNPHDIVLFPAWARRGNPIEASPLDPPAVPEAPTANEDLSSKPAAQIAYRETYPSGYGPVPAVAQEERSAVPRSVLPAACRSRRPARSGPFGNHRQRPRQRDRAHLRSRGTTRRTRRPPPKVVHALRRSDARAVLDRSRRLERHDR